MSETTRTAADLNYRRRQRWYDRPLTGPYGHPFSNATINMITGAGWRFLHELHWLIRCRKRDAPGQCSDAWASQSYFAEKIGVTREYVCRLSTHLALIGVIKKTYHRPSRKTGKYQTCAYNLTEGCRWLLGRIIHALSSPKHHVMYTSPKHSSTHILSRITAGQGP